MVDVTTTQKISGLSEQTELEYLESEFHRAGNNMLCSPTKENVAAYEEATAKLKAAEDAYREGYRLLLSREVGLANNSQKLHLL